MIAGALPLRALGLGLSMALLQFAIGATNDVVDAPHDRGRVPPKPIPAGKIGPRQALGVAVVCGLAGLVLATLVGPGAADPPGATLALVLLGGVVLLIGLAYDVRAKGTPLSWLPFAVGLPLLPVYGWLGAVGELPALFAIVVPIAFLEGAALAIANARADLERDRLAGVRSVATWLGDVAGGRLGLVLQAGVGLLAVLSAAWLGVGRAALILVLVASILPAAGSILGLPAGSVPGLPHVRGVDGRAERARRARSWEVQAIGAALLSAAWLWAAASAGSLG